MTPEEYLAFVRIVEKSGWRVFENDYDENAIPKQVELVTRTPLGMDMDIVLQRTDEESFVGKFISYVEGVEWEKEIGCYYKLVLPFPDIYDSNLDYKVLHDDFRQYKKVVIDTANKLIHQTD